jgi:hypothetical protein
VACKPSAAASGSAQPFRVPLDQQNETKDEHNDAEYGNQNQVFVQKHFEAGKDNDNHWHDH